MATNIPRFDFKRAMYIVGGIGVILWGIGSVIAMISIIVIMSSIISIIPTTPLPTPPPFGWPGQLYTLISLSIVTYIFFIIAYLIVVIFGARLLQQKFSWQLAFVFLLFYALAILMASVVSFYIYSQSGVAGTFLNYVYGRLGVAGTFLNYGILWLISSIFILISTFITRFSGSLPAKMTGIIFGLVSIILLMVGNYYSIPALFSLYIPALFILQNFFLLNPFTSTLGFVAIIYALIIGMIAIFLRGSVIGKLILGMIIIAPLLYGISISIDNFSALSLLQLLLTLLGQIPQMPDIPPALSMFISVLGLAITLDILAAILGGAGGILIVIGSGLGLGHTIIEGINLLGKRTPTAPQVLQPQQPTQAPPTFQPTTSEEVSTSQVEKPNFCPNCGNKLKGDEQFCSSCGKKLK